MYGLPFMLPKRRRTRWILATVSILLSAFVTVIYQSGKCDMEANLLVSSILGGDECNCARPHCHPPSSSRCDCSCIFSSFFSQPPSHASSSHTSPSCTRSICRASSRELLRTSLLAPRLLSYYHFTLLHPLSHIPISSLLSHAFYTQQPLFTYATHQLNSIDAKYWIDYGTLLGGVREGRLLAHEFDLDLAATEEECPRIISALKDKVNADGYHAYERGEWITAKYNKILGHDGYMHKPCFRIYDANHQIFVDIDWYRTYTPKEVREIQAKAKEKVLSDQPTTSATSEHGVGASQASRTRRGGVDGDDANHSAAVQRSLQSSASALDPAATDRSIVPRVGGLDLPAEYDLDGTENLLCNDEGISGDGDPGGCRLESWLLPLREFTFQNGIRTYAPLHAEQSLQAMYGSDWRIPRGKGYKKLVCSWFPRSNSSYYLLMLCTLAGPILIYMSLLYLHSKLHHLDYHYQRILANNPSSPIGILGVGMTHIHQLKKHASSDADEMDTLELARLSSETPTEHLKV